MARKTLNTEVPTEGAEYLVQGMLCREGIPTFKAPAHRSVYDLVSINPVTKKAVTIQVKSRFQTDCQRAFLVRHLGADFFAFVFLNRGNWYDDKPLEDIKGPEYYIVPKAKVESIVDTKRTMPKFFIGKNNPELKKYRDAWYLIAQNLGIDTVGIIRGDKL